LGVALKQSGASRASNWNFCNIADGLCRKPQLWQDNPSRLRFGSGLSLCALITSHDSDSVLAGGLFNCGSATGEVAHRRYREVVKFSRLGKIKAPANCRSFASGLLGPLAFGGAALIFKGVHLPSIAIGPD